jgi:hypothetical protein
VIVRYVTIPPTRRSGDVADLLVHLAGVTVDYPRDQADDSGVKGASIDSAFRVVDSAFHNRKPARWCRSALLVIAAIRHSGRVQSPDGALGGLRPSGAG